MAPNQCSEGPRPEAVHCWLVSAPLAGVPGISVALADRGGRETDVVTSSSSSSVFAGFRFPREVISVAVRWYLRYGLSYRDMEELLAERGVTVDHVTVYRWVQRFTPEFIEAARRPAASPAGTGLPDRASQNLMIICTGARRCATAWRALEGPKRCYSRDCLLSRPTR